MEVTGSIFKFEFVTEEEYEKTKAFVEHYFVTSNIKYATSLNFKIALFSIKKKFFTPKV